MNRYAPHVTIRFFNSPSKVIHPLLIEDIARPQLVLMELHYPNEPGWKLLDFLEKLPLLLPVVVLSSSILPHDQTRALRYTMIHDYITKPFTSENIESLRKYGLDLGE